MAATYHLCNEQTQDQLRTIEWAKSSKYYSQFIDWNKKVGLLGFSMGGQASNLSAGNAAAVAELNIGAAVALNPYAKKFSPSLVPILYAAGSLDLVTPATYIEDMYR